MLSILSSRQTGPQRGLPSRLSLWLWHGEFPLCSVPVPSPVGTSSPLHAWTHACVMRAAFSPPKASAETGKLANVFQMSINPDLAS